MEALLIRIRLAVLVARTGHDQKAPEWTARTAAIFVAICLRLVLCAPFIVRHGPSTDDHMAALATQLVKPRCVSNPDAGVVCQGKSIVVRNGRPASEPDL